MRRYFGTDGIRGVANRKLTCELALSVGRACASVFGRSARLFIGRDTRISGQMLANALMAGAASMGMGSVDGGVLPTPAVSLLTRHCGCEIGVVISASHNGIEDNGIKIFSKDGFKLPDAVEDRIEEMMDSPFDDLPTGTGIGMTTVCSDAGEIYVNRTAECVGADLKGMRIALDCANGAAAKLAPELFRRMGAEVSAINDERDGSRINVRCGSTNMTALSALVVEKGCDMGAAFDGDADRVLFVDSSGRRVDGDQIMGLIALDLKSKGRLAGNVVVSTVMSNMGFELAMKDKGIDLVRTKVGDRYVVEKLRELGASIGGEQSGHVILSEWNTTGDGMLTAAAVASIVRASGRGLGEIADLFEPMPQILVNVRVASKDGWESDPEISAAIAGHSAALEGRGRVLVRPSGTEPLIRVMVEGESGDEIRAAAEDIASVIKGRLG